MKNLNDKLKCIWKQIVEHKGTTMENPNKKLQYCRDYCNGFQFNKQCYHRVKEE